MTISHPVTQRSVHLPLDAVEQLRSRLLSEVVELADQAAECRSTAEDLTGQTDSDSVLEREVAEVSAAHFDAAVSEARDALRRLDEGTYGACERCAAPIPLERLEAIPHARRCVNCPDSPAGLLD